MAKAARAKKAKMKGSVQKLTVEHIKAKAHAAYLEVREQLAKAKEMEKLDKSKPAVDESGLDFLVHSNL